MLQQHLLARRCYTIRLTALIVFRGARAQSLRLVYGIITNRKLSTLVTLEKFFKALKPLKQRLLNQRSFSLNMVPDIELFSRCSDGSNIFATWAFNKRKDVREKNPEDCTELSHHDYHVQREVKPSVY